MNKTTKKVKLLLLNESKTSLAERIGITRPTLDNRLMFSNWKLSECKLIETL